MPPQTEPDELINRDQMIAIAWHYNLRISRSTIHRWANEPEFPLTLGKEGKCLLYARRDFVGFLNRRLKKMQADH